MEKSPRKFGGLQEFSTAATLPATLDPMGPGLNMNFMNFYSQLKYFQNAYSVYTGATG